MRFDTNWNADETRRPSSRTTAQAPITMSQCSQARCPQTQVGTHSGGQTVQ